MELTSKDKRYIEEQVKKIDMRVKVEATEYARLCERYYYERLLEKINIQLEVLEQYPQLIQSASNGN